MAAEQPAASTPEADRERHTLGASFVIDQAPGPGATLRWTNRMTESRDDQAQESRSEHPHEQAPSRQRSLPYSPLTGPANSRTNGERVLHSSVTVFWKCLVVKY